MAKSKLPHLKIESPTSTYSFTNRKQMGAKTRIPLRDRISHSECIKNKLQDAWKSFDEKFVTSHSDKHGLYLEFKGKTGYDLATNGLENMRNKKIRLCNIRNEAVELENNEGQNTIENVVYATVYIPNDQRNFFLDKVQKYASEYNTKTLNRETIFPEYENFKDLLNPLFEDCHAQKLRIKDDITNDEIQSLSNYDIPEELILKLKKKPKNYEFIEKIEDVKAAVAKSFWVDSLDLFPDSDRIWCEVWLRSDVETVELEFIRFVTELSIPIKQGRLVFPERIIKIIHANAEELENIQAKFPWIAEFRKAKTTANFWINQPNRDNAEWVEDFLDRLTINEETNTAICILDNGVNNGHPLLRPILKDADKLSVNEEWGTSDHDPHGHGTLMAGLAGYGDLQLLLESDEKIVVQHLLESSKIIPPPPNENEPELWGFMTKQGVSIAEINASVRNRIICMAITAEDTRDQGKPSSWSAALDQLTSGEEDDTKRIFIVSAGNYTCNFSDLIHYPDSQILDSLHDPAQSWNAITVGSYTNLTTISDPVLKDYSPLASVGQISPFSTTSFTWENKWPIKPDIVFEGGNIAKENTSNFITECNDLSLISTNFNPQENYFTNFNMTSASTSLASNFAAKIQSLYPDYWPESIRGLMIHSANWTEGMKVQFPEENSSKKVRKLLKAVGYGVPDYDKAVYCANNSLTLMSQAEIQPYDQIIKNKVKKRITKDMHFYELPWPTTILENLENTPVEMRVTLSYFIEPSPGQVGWNNRYRYPSHLLRFDNNSPTETKEEFLARVNAEMEDDDNHYTTSSSSSHWVIGSQNRHRGSVHSDIWKGTARELAASNKIAIYPRIGWWKERHYLEKFDKKTRYSLIVSIHTPEEKTDIDIYTPIAVQIPTVITS